MSNLRTLVGLVAVAIIVGACGGAAVPTASSTVAGPSPSPTPDQTKAVGLGIRTLAQGRVGSLPVGPLYINVIDIPQAAGGSVTHKHVPGFVYVVAGTHTMPVEGQPTQELRPGEAGFVGDQTHSHTNSGQSANDWYFVSIRPSTLRSSTLVPGQKVLFETQDLPLLTGTGFVESLSSARLELGGRSDRTRSAGIAMIYVLDGTLRVRTDSGNAIVEKGTGLAVLPGTCAQQFAEVPTTFLVLTVAADPTGQPVSCE